MIKSNGVLIFILLLSFLTVILQAKSTEDNSHEHGMDSTGVATDKNKHSHEAESLQFTPGDDDSTDDDDGEVQPRSSKFKKIFQSASKKEKRHGMKEMMMKEGKEMKRKMKCSMMEKKKAALDERFHYVWKALMTMKEEITRLQESNIDSRFPLECPPENINEAKCKKDENSQMCSGNGYCSCGVCICNPNHPGMFCECEPCEYIDGKQCGGPDRGQCVCGKCECQQQYIGNNCECESTDTDTSACQDPNLKSLICSGNGDCICNTCLCQEGYHGSLCQEQVSSSNECNKLKLCVLCQVFYEEDPGCSRCDLEVTMVDQIAINENQQLCKVSGQNKNCFLNFAYTPSVGDSNRLEVEVEKMKCQLNFA